MKLKLIIPESWNDVSISKYIKIASIDNKNLNDTALDILGILTDVDRQMLDQIDTDELNIINNELSWLVSPPDTTEVRKEFKIGRDTYKYSRMFDKMTVGEMISYEMLVDNNNLTDIETLPYILAIILRKEVNGKLEKFNANTVFNYVELFNDKLSIGETMGLLFFFKNGGRNYITVLEDSLSQLKTLKTEILRN